MEHSNLAELVGGFDKHFENFDSKEIKRILNKLKFKLQSVLKILNFSKTQILYEKNLKLIKNVGLNSPNFKNDFRNTGHSFIAESSKKIIPI